MVEINDGGPAFPTPLPSSQYGMSLRDWFAAHAPEATDHWVETWQKIDRSRNPYNEAHRPKLRSEIEIRAAYRWEYADAMIAARQAAQAVKP